MNEKLRKLQARKLALVNQMRDLNNEAKFDETAYARAEEDMASIEKEIEREIRLSDIEATLNQTRDIPEVDAPKTNQERKEQDQDKRHRDAFETMLRMPLNALNSETRAVLNTLVGSEGGYLVPETYVRDVIDKLLEMSVVRQLAYVFRTTSTTNIPLGITRPQFAFIAEKGTYGKTEPTFGQAVLGAYKLGGIIQTSEELLQDSFIDLQAYITRLIVEGISDKEEAAFTVGSGIGEPQGFLVGGQLGKTAAGASAITLDEVLDLEYSVRAPYRPEARFMMNSKTELALRKLKDTQGQYLWQPSLQVGAPNMFDGKPIAINEEMPDIGTGNKPIAFGNFRYLNIADRAGLEIKRLDELYAENGLIGWRVSKRVDSKVVQPEAIKYLQNA